MEELSMAEIETTWTTEEIIMLLNYISKLLLKKKKKSVQIQINKWTTWE